MTSMKFKRGPSTKLNSLGIEDGSLIITTDKKQLFFDIGSDRVPIGHEMATDEDILQMFGGAAVASAEDITAMFNLNGNAAAPISDEGTTVSRINGSDEIIYSEF